MDSQRALRDAYSEDAHQRDLQIEARMHVVAFEQIGIVAVDRPAQAGEKV